MIDHRLIEFLNEHKQLIQAGRWNELYQALLLLEDIPPYLMSEILIQVNPCLPNDLQDLPGACFAGVHIPGTILTLSNKSIGWEAFDLAKLPSQVNLMGVDSVGQEAFYRSQLDNLRIIGNTRLEEGTFKGCKVVNADLSGWNTEKLAPYLFSRCERLTTVKLPDSLREISAYAFAGCSNLSSIDLPSQLVTIYRGAFNQCELQTVTTPKTVKEFLDTTQGIVNLLGFCSATALMKCTDKTISAAEMQKLLGD